MTCDWWLADAVGWWQLPTKLDATLSIIREYSENEQEVSLYETQDLPMCWILSTVLVAHKGSYSKEGEMDFLILV